MTSPVYRRMLVGLAALGLGASGALVAVAPAHAATTYTVKNTLGNVTDVDSLPWAIDQANANPDVDTIVFVAGLGPLITIVDLMTIEESVIITGPGRGALTIEAPGTVFEITPTTPVIDVTISGVTLAPTLGSSGCGIDAIDARLRVSDVTANGFDCMGIAVVDGSLVATDVTTNDNASSGIGFSGNDPGESVTLTRVVANGNLWGVYVETTDAINSISGAQLDDNLVGTQVLTHGGSMAVSGMSAINSGALGIGITSTDGAVTTITGSSATSSPGQGFLLGAGIGGSITASHLTATGNETGGVQIGANSGSSVELQASLIEDNGDPCGCSTTGGIVIDADESTVVISGTRVLHNLAQNGAGIYVRSHSGASGILTITDSTVSRNVATGSGGGIYAFDLGSASNTGTFSIVRTTVADNTASLGGGAAIDGFSHVASGAPAVLIDSTTISGNTANLDGGGVFAQKSIDTGGVGLIRVVNSTVSGNIAPQTSGLVTYGNTPSAGEMATEILHSTIAANTGSGGLNVEGRQTVLLSHLLAADNDVNDLEQFLTDSLDLTIIHSLIENPDATAALPVLGNIVGIDPALGPLKDNGGPTFTHLITPGSAAYNAGNPAITGAPAYDQRGLARIYQTIDIGAVEWHPVLAATGSEPEPEPGLVGLLLLFTGLALLAASRRFAL